MDTQPKRRKVQAFLKRATTRFASNTDLRLSANSLHPQSNQATEVVHGPTQDEKKEGRLGRLGRGIRQWRARRTKPHVQSHMHRIQHTPFPQRLTPSEESLLIDHVPPQTSQEEAIPKEFNQDQTASHGVVFQETVPEKEVETPEPTVHEAVTPKQEIPKSTILQESVSQEPSLRQAAPKNTSKHEIGLNDCIDRTQENPQRIVPTEKEDNPEPIYAFPFPTGYSLFVWSEIVPQAEIAKDKVVVFMRNEKHAHDFAQSISNDKRAFWTDASHRCLKLTGGNFYHHGGIAVAHQLNMNRWIIHSAHVTGLSITSDLEKLAILLALQRAVRDREAELRESRNTMNERPVFKICSDSMTALLWLKKAISVGSAVRKAARMLETTSDDADNLGGLLTLSAELDTCGVFRFGNYSRPEKTFTTSIGRRILEEYYKLCKLGTVEFHWVPAHKGLLGNEIADNGASIACLWYANVAPRLGVGVGLVMPLEVREAQGRQVIPGQQPTDIMALQTLEGAKDLWVVLTIESSREAMTRHSAIQLGTITTSHGEQLTSNLLPLPISCAKGITTCGSVSMTSGTVVHETLNRGTVSAATAAAEGESTKQPSRHQSNAALKVISVTDPGAQSSTGGPDLTVKRNKRSRGSRGGKGRESQEACGHCGRTNHITAKCFEQFPETKQTRSKEYRKWSGRRPPEKVTPGAFSLIRRLHPQLKGIPCPGGVSRYMLGRAGFNHDLTSLPTYRSVKFPVKRGNDAAFPDQMALQYRQFLLAKYEWPQ